MSVSVAWPPTSPAPSTRGPLARRLARLYGRAGLTPITGTDTLATEAVTLRLRASFRMPSDETLRVALVCTLPLLHLSPSLVAVVRFA